MEQPKAIKVTAAIIMEGGRLLVALRAPGGRHPGAWEFPGGKVEPDESPEDCIAREMAEELDVAVDVGERIAEVPYTYPDLDIELIAFKCTISGGRPRDVGCSAHAWVSPLELENFDLLPADRKLADIILR
jgi:8-oxo-dGTP diphosphatase